MLLRQAKLVTTWSEALRRMEPLEISTRSILCEENTTLLASSGAGLALDGMANVSKPLKSVETDSKLKMLISLNQNGMWPGIGIQHSLLRRQ